MEEKYSGGQEQQDNVDLRGVEKWNSHTLSFTSFITDCCKQRINARRDIEHNF